MRLGFGAASLAALLVLGCAAPAFADDAPAKDKADATAKDKEKEKDANELPPLPAPVSQHQSVQTKRGVLNYTVTVGAIPVRDEKGKKIGDVVYHSYVLDKTGPNRPVTFAFNGGPGAASVYLNLGAIGPKHVAFGAQGDVPSSSAVLTDNPDTWLGFTDLVFIDPVGTGFSRSYVDEEQSKKYFYAMNPDIQYLSRVVFDWLVKYGRLTSPKYVSGESYGGFRAPRIAHYLQTRQGVGVSGIVMVSPLLDGALDADDDLSPTGWMERLPSMAAAKLEREGRLTAENMAPIEAYIKSDFMVDYMKGPQDAAAQQRLNAKMVELLGVDPALVQTMGGRVDTQTLLRQLYRHEGKVGSRYDINFTMPDPFPFSYEARQGGARDPILDQITAPTTSAMVDFDTRILGWKVDAPYYSLNYDVGRLWQYHDEIPDAVTDLRQAMAIDPTMKVMIVHGYSDLSCPFFASQMILDQMPPSLGLSRISLKEYPGGHMFYSRPDSRAALYRDVQSLYPAG
jgi:carboxypeptidase C (cathepsin A)